MAGADVAPSAFYDVFLSHASSDKPWVRSLGEGLQAAGLSVFLDEQQLAAPRNFVDELSSALGSSRSLVLVASPRAALSDWVRQEWTSYVAHHGPRDRIVVVVLEPVEVPPLLAAVQRIDATGRDVATVAAQVLRAVGRADQLPEGDARALTFGQDLVFVLVRTADGQLDLTDPAGRSRRIAPPWQTGAAYTVAALRFQKLAHEPVTNDSQRAEQKSDHRVLAGLPSSPGRRRNGR